MLQPTIARGGLLRSCCTPFTGGLLTVRAAPRSVSHSQKGRGRTVRSMADSAGAHTAAAAASSGAAAHLWQSISERYDSAQRDAAATMTETNTEVVADSGVQFVLRVAAKLRDKPKPPPDAQDGQPKKEWRNPFLPYEQALWVANLGASHVLLLNKFNIVPWHCLVVTADFRSQLDDMDAADWGATWAVLQSMPRGGLAFYNCGPASGASQPHKHMQLVPLPLDGSNSSSDSSSDGSSSLARPPIWPAVAAAAAASSAPAGQPFELRNLPFAAFAATLEPPGRQQGQQQEAGDGAAAGSAAAEGATVPAVPAEEAAGEYLAGVYQQLLGHCRGFVEAHTGRAGVSPQDGSLSYNMVCTRDFMMLVPRRQEADGPVSCNSVAFAGSIFVRSREEQQYVAQRGPLRILAATGYDW